MTHAHRRIPFSFLVPAAFALALALPGCGGSEDPAKLTDSGYAALGASDYKGALADFQKALAAMPTSDPSYKRTKMGEVEALVHVDAAKAKDEFLALAKGNASQVESKDFIAVATKLTGAQKLQEAIAVLEAGLKAHSEDVKLKQVGEKIKEAAAKSGDSKALDSLKGLGYL